MATPLIHAKSSVKKHGGKIEDYLPIHKFLDQTKGHYADFRHRAVLHSTFGMILCETIFGDWINNSDHMDVEVRQIAYEHIMEDLGKVPSVEEWLKHIQPQPWMMKGNSSKLTRTIHVEELEKA